MSLKVSTSLPCLGLYAAQRSRRAALKEALRAAAQASVTNALLGRSGLEHPSKDRYLSNSAS